MYQKKLIIFMPSIEGGGVEKNLIIISNFLAKKIDNLSLITVSKIHKSKFDHKINFVSTKKNWNKLGRKLKYLIALYLLYKEIVKNDNRVVFAFQANIYCIILCKLFNTKIIVRSNSSPSGWSKNFLKNIIFKSILGMANKIIVNSFVFQKELNRKFHVKSICVYNPLNISEIQKLSKKKQIDTIKTKHLKIINVGRFTDQKDHITLLKAVNLLKDKIPINLLILGRGINKNKMLNYIFTNKLQKIVTIKNFTENPYPHIKNSDLMVLSSLYEGLPNVLLESLALNIFTISSNCPTGPSEILDSGKGGLLFKVGNHKDLANKIKFFYTNKKICKKMLNHSRSRLKRFDYSENLRKYLKIVNSVMID